MDTAPVSSEGRTMLPIKYVTDALGATLAWDGQAKKVSIIKGDTTVELWIGQNTARVNGAERLIDSGNPNVRPFIAPPGRTMLPLRFISESLGCTVNWNAELQEASIDY
jgi:titin